MKSGRLTVVVIVTHNHLLYLSVFGHLAPKVLVERVEVVLQLARIHLVLGVECRVLIHVREEDGLRVGRFDMLSRAPVAMAAGSDLIVERAVDLDGLSVRCSVPSMGLNKKVKELRENGVYATYLVLLSSKDGREIIGHVGIDRLQH